MDMFGDFFGTNPATPEEREAESKRLLGIVEIDNIIKDGKVYLNSDELNLAFTQISRMLAARAILLQDPLSQGASTGMHMAANILDTVSGEFLRREADAILKAGNDGA